MHCLLKLSFGECETFRHISILMHSSQYPWNGNVILMKFPAPAALEFISNAASDENFHQNDNISVSVIDGNRNCFCLLLFYIIHNDMNVIYIWGQSIWKSSHVFTWSIFGLDIYRFQYWNLYRLFSYFYFTNYFNEYLINKKLGATNEYYIYDIYIYYIMHLLVELLLLTHWALWAAAVIWNKNF